MPPLGELPVERFQSFVLWRLMDGRDEQGISKLKATLWLPPAGEEAEEDATSSKQSPWNPENENAALGALMKQLGG